MQCAVYSIDMLHPTHKPVIKRTAGRFVGVVTPGIVRVPRPRVRWCSATAHARVDAKESSLEGSLDPQDPGTCGHCRYPCHLSGFTECDASEYLAMWAEDAILKPDDGFDTKSAINSSSIDAAAVSMGGRANGRWKHDNQDAFLLKHVAPDSITDSLLLLGVFDGHGRFGHKVSHMVRDAFNSFMESIPMHQLFDQTDDVVSSCFSSVAAHIDAAQADFSCSGATAVLCAVNHDKLVAAWAGDSRAVIGLSGTGDDGRPVRVVLPLTKDHKPDPSTCPMETQRILAAGGRVDRLACDAQGNPIGPFRIFLRNAWTPGLALSRAFGDRIARNIGVVPLPEVTSILLPDHFSRTELSLMRHVLIVASDGLWEWMDAETATAIAWGAGSSMEAADALVEAARQHWAVKYRGRTCDDITVLVAFL